MMLRIAFPYNFITQIPNFGNLYEYIGDGFDSKTLELDKIYKYVEIIPIQNSNHSHSVAHQIYSAIAIQGETTKIFDINSCYLNNNILKVYNSSGYITATPKTFHIELNKKNCKYLLNCHL